MATNNATILDNIWLNGSNDYQQRVPQASQAGVDAVADVLFANGNRSYFNEFHEGLINRICTSFVNQWSWANPLAAFKREALAMGATIQEISVDLIKASGYNFEDNNLFKRNPAKVYEAFHTVNRQDKYLVTLNVAALKAAFTTEYGLNELLAREMAMPGLSDEYDEFRIMVQLIGRAFANDELYKVATPFANPLAPTAEELKALSIAIRTNAGRMGFPSGRYNAKGVPTVSRKEDLVLITTPEVVANLDVNVLADAFNIDRTDFASNMVVIDEFPMAGVYAMLADRNWLVCADYLRETEVFRNGASLEVNFYYHHWGVYSTSPFSNAVIFGDVQGTETGVVNLVLNSISAQAVNAAGANVNTFSYGDDLHIEVRGSSTTTPENKELVAPAGYTVEISLADSEGAAIERTVNTSLSRTGALRVQEGLVAGDKITIVATSTYVNPSGDGKKPASPKKSTKTLTVA